ncbi:hypothetical protein ZWY2020_002682 [Hordeum vulgare]|nr:hypothetical protein ZWY2020_002682 [Hordeum vulgare]
MAVPQPGGGEAAGRIQEHKAHDWADVTGGAVRYIIKDLGMALEVVTAEANVCWVVTVPADVLGHGGDRRRRAVPAGTHHRRRAPERYPQITDLATLTGACVVALGPSIAGIFTPSDELA